MAISDTQKVDYLFKKIGFGISKTDTSTVKSPSNETIASPLILRGDIIWQQGASIPNIQPGATTGVVTVYSDANSNTVECVADSTSTLYRTWKTNLTDWISPEYGSTYQVKVYLDSPAAGMPQSTGTRIFPDGTGNNDEWYFDYASGVLNFIGTNLPSVSFAGKSIFVVGARYTGQKGLVNFPGGMTIGNINLNGNQISIVNTNGNLALNANGAGYVTLSNAIASNIQVTNSSNFYSNVGIGGNLNVTGNTTIGGNLQVNGDIVGFSANTVTIFDSLLYLASNNTESDLIDIGIVGHYNNGSANLHTGVMRDAVTKEYYFFDGYTIEPETNDIDINNVGFSLANLNVSNLKLGTSVLSSDEFVTNSNISFVTPGTVNLVTTSAVLVPVGNVTQRPVGVEGYLRYNNETNILEYYNGTEWVTLNNTISQQLILCDGINDTYNLDQPATANGIIVNINGTVQVPNVAYTINGSNQIVFAEIPQATDVVDIRYISAGFVDPNQNFDVIDTPTRSVSDSPTVIDTFSANLYRSAKYTISSNCGSDYEIAEILLVHNGVTANVNSISTSRTGSNTITYSATVSSFQVQFSAVGSASSNQLRIQKTYFQS
jgi:hypothetical protein